MRHALAVLTLAVVGVGCVPDSGEPVDGGHDAGLDSGVPVDAGHGVDAGVDAGFDAGSVIDAGVMDAGMDAGGPLDAGSSDAGPPGFEVSTPNINVPAGEEGVWCSFFRTTNDAGVSVKSWQATFGPGVVSATVLFTEIELSPPGTVTTTPSDCDFGQGTWAFTAWAGQQQWSFPSDDGAGKPIGSLVPANQVGVIRLHLVNATASAINTAVTVKAVGHPSGAVVTNAASYVGYNGMLNIPSTGAATSQSMTCPTPSGAKFTWLSAYAHKQATSLSITGGASVLFQSTNWEQPGATQASAPFSTFANDQATLSCDYVNSSGRTIRAGPDVRSDEHCVMLGYSFPAIERTLCLNGFIVN